MSKNNPSFSLLPACVQEQLVINSQGLCAICGMPFDLTTTPPDDFARTMDHIIPVADGGTEVVENLQLVHNYCNQKRGRRALSNCHPEQWRRLQPLRDTLT